MGMPANTAICKFVMWHCCEHCMFKGSHLYLTVLLPLSLLISLHLQPRAMQVFVYYKAMSKPVSRRLFSTPAEAARHAHNQDPSQFISAVCWKPDSQVLLSANSQGTIKVMQVTA